MVDELHTALWQQFNLNRSQNRLSHAILLLGAHYLKADVLARRMAAAILCPQLAPTHCKCQSCYLFLLNEHPDVIYLPVENNIIKIDQVRAIQNTLYTAPVLANNRVVIIDSSEKLNIAASNALLKILEEPPRNVYFILTAAHLSTLPATIQSRCQLWRLSLPAPSEKSYLHQELFKNKEDIFDNLSKFISELIDLQNDKINVNALASRWNKYDFREIIELLYLITAEMIKNKLTKIDEPTVLQQLEKRFNGLQLFIQIDKLHEIIKNLNHTINSNPLLVLEDFLLNYKAW